MRTIKYLLYKEFRQIARNKAILPLIFVVPIVQLIILAHAATFEIRGLKLFWVDKDQSTISRLLYSKFEGSAYFSISGSDFSLAAGEEALQLDQADLVLQVPANFERDLFREQQASLQLITNAIDGVKGGLGTAYAQAVIQDYNRQLIEEYGSKLAVGMTDFTAKPSASQPAVSPSIPSSIHITYAYWFNTQLDYKTFMVPGILALLITLIGAFLSSMNIVREKELGTIEQINVTPIKKYQFIIGKLLPFWVIALFELAFGLLVAKLLYDIPFLGSIWTLFGFASIYLLVILGIGLFVSTITETQQQAMFVSWFILLVFILMSGMFTAIENMPLWAQQISYANPVRYFMEVIRMVMLKGAGLVEIKNHLLIMLIAAIGINGLAIWNYRKTSA